MTAAEKIETIRDLNDTRSAFLHSLDSFPPEQFTRQRADGGWSAAQIAEHVVFVEGRALARIQATLSTGPEPGRKSSMNGKDTELFEQVRSRAKKIQAPPGMDPAGAMSHALVRDAFLKIRQTTLQFTQANEADLHIYFAPHPLLGVLDCYQWLRLIAAHGERHRAQLEDLRGGL